MPRKIPTFRPRHHAATQRALLASYERGPQRRADKRFYASDEWRSLRLAYIQQHPLCEDCLEQGTFTPSEHVHHVIDRKKAPELALEWTNLRGLCVPCHSRHATFGRG